MSQKSRKVCIVSDSSEQSEARNYSTHERYVYSVPNSNYETSYATYLQANNNSNEEVHVQQNVSSLLIFCSESNQAGPNPAMPKATFEHSPPGRQQFVLVHSV